MKNVTIVGAGLVGSLLAVYFAKRGYKVKVFERRSDLRGTDLTAGKSINLALSDRGWKALEKVGVDKEIAKMAIPMYGRRMHSENGDLSFQSYGLDDQAIYSVSRGGINAKLMDFSEAHDNVSYFFNEKCVDVDLENASCTFENTQSGKTTNEKSDLVFGADGAFSAVRYRMQKTDRFDYSQSYLKHGYKEILLPANEDGTHKLEKNALHIWPRGGYMLIALPNLDGSYTCTLFLPFEGENSFEQLSSKEAITQFFKEKFHDFYKLVPNIADIYDEHPTSSLAIIRCYPWTYGGKTALIGDAAHAIVPFYGQGMIAGFEDCRILDALIDEHKEDWSKIMKAYEESRKPNGDAIADLALKNFIEMRDLVGDPKFLLRKKIEKKIYEKHPNKWVPMYSKVTFSPDTPYSVALADGLRQEKIMDKIMEMPDIESRWDSDEVEQAVLSQI